jgi:iron-sulfur cluster assembly protein
MIHLSQAAVNEIRRLQQSRQQLKSFLRLRVKKGGCSGLYYTFELSEISQPSDLLYECQGITMVIDPQSHIYLNGLKLDYAEDLMGGGFRFQNPNTSATCGCGLSFASPS